MYSGYFDAAIYVLLSSLAFVFLDHLILGLNPLVALLAMSSIALLVFNLLSINKITQTYQVCWQHKSTYFWMSVGLAGDWICMVYASHESDPFIAMAALFISLALIGFLRLSLFEKNLTKLSSSTLLVLSLILLGVFYKVPEKHSVCQGIFLGAIAGGAFYSYIANSAKLSMLGGLNSLQVLSTRFWLLWLIAFILVPKVNLWSNIYNNLNLLVPISFASLIIPIYFNQRAIQKLGAELTAVFIGLVPPVTFVCYVIYTHEFHWLNALVGLIITFALMLPTLFNSRASGG